MTVNRYALGLLFCCFYVVSYFTNKYVLSVLKFTYPTLFQGLQTFVGGLLLLVSGRLGLVEISRFPRILGYRWIDFVSNERLLEESRMKHIACIVRECQLRHYGRVARSPEGDPARRILIVRTRVAGSDQGKHLCNTWLWQMDGHFWRVGLDRVSAWGVTSQDPEEFRHLLGAAARCITVVLSWLPGSLLFVGNIYAGSRALSRLPIPMFFTLHNASEVVTHVTSRLTHKEHASWTKLLSVSLLLVSAVSLPLVDPQFDPGGYFWAVIHCLCVGAYRVFQKLPKYSHLSDLEQQCINYIFSVLLLAVAAHPTGDLFGVFEFPFLQSYRFHSGCCASALLGFFLLLTAVKLKSGLPLEHCASWLFLAKILAACLSPFVFDIVVSKSALCCLLVNYAGEGLLVYSEYNAASR